MTPHEKSTLDRIKAQHRADGEALMKGPNLLAAARRALHLLRGLEIDSGEYYRETVWLEQSVAAAEAEINDSGPR